MSISLGAAIYIAIKPILKIYTIILVGFLLARFNVVSMEHAKGISNMVVNAILPCLTFNKIVSNITWRDIKEVGVIVLTALIFFGFGAIGSLLIYKVASTPKKFFWSILFAGLFPNISDLPIAYVQSMGNGTIFQESDADKGVAYSCIFLFTQSFLMMNFGMWRMIGLDTKDDNNEENSESKESDLEGGSSTPDEESQMEEKYENDELELESTQSDLSSDVLDAHSFSHDYTYYYRGGCHIPIAHFANNTQIHRTTTTYSSPSFLEPSKVPKRDDSLLEVWNISSKRTKDLVKRRMRKASINDIISTYSAVENIRNGELNLNRPLTITEKVGKTNAFSSTGEVEDDLFELGEQPSPMKKYVPNFGLKRKFNAMKAKSSQFLDKYNMGWVSYFIINFIRPASLGSSLGIICALIPWVQACFTSTYVHVHQAPDNEAVLNYLMDFTEYIGNACVPLGLILLGGTLARLEVKKLPKGFLKTAILFTVLRLIICPIIGILWANKLYDMNWLDTRIGKFDMILTWAMPCSTSQVYFTAFYTPIKGSHLQMDCLSVLYICQYIVLFISLSIVVTYTLKVDLNV
ncbi:hypothetical protein KAFR_0H02050 [Kazachstania africana CBS 2517]|uniref:Auxin efflux carrier n=1 Tax=Kazachstania africana (strain ATCC 22294 / BCRC 22015 / CBS 2517 / CECT 1963 / NBRC 1671 / NRRL Y-8276) TaxID=1071382 RepID=H2AZ58_KAZAF|nr:hypothetical protein KAFR_0H02050 [Kazachstania africana CBS 2517]CCF59614.1 hypothetical protein KAFR_0H02050 [Kazachstania africana CBS 2517]